MVLTTTGGSAIYRFPHQDRIAENVKMATAATICAS